MLRGILTGGTKEFFIQWQRKDRQTLKMLTEIFKIIAADNNHAGATKAGAHRRQKSQAVPVGKLKLTNTEGEIAVTVQSRDAVFRDFWT